MKKYLLVLAGVILIAGCTQNPEIPNPDTVGLANPASVHCSEQNTTTLEIRKDPLGGEYGVCIFEDGTECEEWRFYRGECKQGDSFITAPPRVQEYCADVDEVYLCKQGIVKKVRENEDIIRFISSRGSEILCQKEGDQINNTCDDLIVEGFCETENVCT